MSDILHRAHRAKIELTETQAAFDAVRSAMVASLTGRALTDTAGMQAMVCGIQALDQVRRIVVDIIDSGAIEEAALDIANSFKAV